MKKHVWLIGAGGMAVDYAKVLKALNVEFLVIGRGEQSAQGFHGATGCGVVVGGLGAYLLTKPKMPTHAIVSVGVENLHETTLQLLQFGIKNILAEKPVGINRQEIEAVHQAAQKCNAHVFVAYNRRFYASVFKAQKIIEEDGGVTSFNFEFTEWAHVIGPLKKAEGSKEMLFLNNSTHVVDLAFYLGGRPEKLCSFTSGGLSWHPKASIFSGGGVSDSGALFSYQANWESAGRWSVEMLTKNHRLIFRPMEKLQIQKKGSIAVEFAECDYIQDENFKPGLYLQTQSFLNDRTDRMCSLTYHSSMMDCYYQISSYE
jgi:predicted dehydrogenase